MAEFDEQVQASLAEEGDARSNITQTDVGSDARLYARNIRKLENRAVKPAAIPSYMPPNPASPLRLDHRGIPTVDPRWVEDADFSAIGQAIPNREDFLRDTADRLESEFYKLQGNERLMWVAGQDPDDLALMGGEAGEVAQRLRAASDWRNTFIRQEGTATLDQQIEEETDRRLRSRERLRNGLRLIPGVGPVAEDLVAEADIEQIRQEVIDDMNAPADEPGWFASILGGAVSGVIGAVSVPFDVMTGQDDEEDIRNAEAAIRQDTERIAELRRQASAGDMEELWQTLADEDPGTHQMFMQMGGGDPFLAMGLFAGFLEDEIAGEDQVAQMESEIEEHLVQMVRDEDYGMSRKMIEGLAAWDRYVPMRLATAATLLLTDEDVQDAVTSGKWGELSRAIEENDYSPAQALGLDKTALGMVIDFAGSIAFDPTTWFFGPKKAGGAQMITREGVEEVVTSGLMRHNIDNIVEALAEGNIAKAYKLGEFLDDVGMADELLELAQRSVDDVGDVAGKGLTPETTASLREIAERGVEKSKGADSGVGGTLRDMYQTMIDRSIAGDPDAPGLVDLAGPERGTTVAPVSVGGTVYRPYHVREIGGNGVMWVSDEGVLGAALRWTDEGAGWYTDPALRGAEHKMMTRTIEGIHHSRNPALGPEAAAEALLRSASDKSITASGAKAVTREVRNYLDNVVGGKGEAAVAALDREAVEEIVRKGLLAGATVPSAQRLAVGVGIANRLRTALADGEKVSGLRRFITPHRTITNFNLRSPGGFRRVVQTTAELWGENLDQASKWTERLLELRRAKTQNKAAMLNDPLWKARKALQEELELLDEQLFGDLTGSKLGELFQDGTDAAGIQVAEEGLESSVTKQGALAAHRANVDKKIARLRAELSAKYKGIDDYTDMSDALNEMWDEYNRDVIAKNPAWADKVDPETGLVPWDELRIGRSSKEKALEVEGSRKMFGDDMLPDPNALGEANELFNTLSGVAGVRQGAHVPLSPIDMMAAASASGAQYRAFVAEGVGMGVREAFYMFHRAWTIDKVMRPSTALVVSFDELQRAFHVFGVEAVGKYTRTKMDRLAARASAILRARGVSVRQGADALPESVQRRLKKQQEYPTMYRDAERQTYEGLGTGWDDIEPGAPGWEDAARRWHGQFLQDQGFRNFLEGEETFARWWNSSAADNVRMKAGPDVTAADAYAGWSKMWDIVSETAEASGKRGEWTEAWKTVAREIEEGGGGVRELPDWVLAHTGTVRGVRKAAPARWNLQALSEKFFDSFFMEPTNYRRGFIHELATEYESARLRKLYASQGREVITDEQLAAQLGFKGQGAELRLVYGDYLDDIAEKMGAVTEGRISSLATSRAIDEIDNIMYSWDTASRLGKSSRGLFPFGGPWGDMIGFWGREMLTKPHLRGWVNESNFLGMRTLANNALKVSPVNPRTASFVSRMANTDTEITEGWAGEGGGLLPGSSRTDLSPLSFLPTSGDNPFGVMLPGIGFVPAFAADQVITRVLSDPELEPERYQEIIDAVSEYVPSMQYTTGPLNQDLVGGGVFGQSVGLIADAVGAFGGVSTYNVTNFLGDIGREINRTREVSAIMAEPGLIEDLLATGGDVEALELTLREIAREADMNAAKSHAAQRGSRLLVPAASSFSTALDDVHDVWVDAAEMFPDELPVSGRAKYLDLEDEDDRRQFANDVRSEFFDLDQATRDRLIVENPRLAVNLVNSWQWTDRANELGHERGTPYRTTGTKEELAKHQYYIENGYIRPVDPYARTERILGLVIASKERTAKRVYEESAAHVNTVIWDNRVSDKTRGLLQTVLDDYGDELKMSTVEEVWEAWGTVEGEYEAFLLEYAAETGREVDPDKLKERISIPTDEKAWSTSYRGVDPESVSSRFSKVTFTEIPEGVLPYAEAVGIELEPGMTGQEIYQAITDNIAQVEGPMYSFVMPAYQTYTSERGAAAQRSDTDLRNQAFNTDFDESYRNNVIDLINLAERTSSDVRDRTTPIKRSEVDAVRDAFTRVMNAAPDTLAWEEVWGNLYERTYGPLNWEEPTPPTLVDPEGNRNSNAYQPYIRKVRDGDSIVVSEKPGPGVFPFASESGDTVMKEVRLIGVRAADFGRDDEGAATDMEKLLDALKSGEQIWLVRDPENFGNTDRYGRELAWLFIGDEPYYDSSGFLPTD